MFLLTWLNYLSAQLIVPFMAIKIVLKVLRAKNGYDLLCDFR